ncbi:MAG: S8 family serine peptidase [Myxococcota bacterium]
MDSSRSGHGSGPTQPRRDITQVLDPGLWGERSAARLQLLRNNLASNSDDSVDQQRLQSIATAFDQGQYSIQMALDHYREAAPAKRWPILVVRPRKGLTAESLEHRLKASGFLGDVNLAPAYNSVHLAAIRVPPEAPFIHHLAANTDIDRIERSWLKASAPQQSLLDASTNEQTIAHPDHLIERDSLATELLSKRDPLRVGLIDSGIDGTHAALKTRVMEQRAFRRGLDSIGDQFGHGTACAGIIARICASAYFMSAKVLDKKGRTNLDDLIRAIAWLRRHRPDLILCNTIMPLPADGHSILSGLLALLIADGIPVIVPTGDSFGSISAPADAHGVITVAPDSAATDSPTTVRASGGPILCPRSIQASDAFVQLEAASWTALIGPGAAAATTTAATALLIRAARLSRHTPSPGEIGDALNWGHRDALFSINYAIQSYIGHLVKAQALDKPHTRPAFRSSEAVTAVGLSARAPLTDEANTHVQFSDEPASESLEAFPIDLPLENPFEAPTISMPVPAEKLERDRQRRERSDPRRNTKPEATSTPPQTHTFDDDRMEHMETLRDMRLTDAHSSDGD